MSIRDFYTTLKTNKKSLELNQLYKKPVPETRKQMPVTQVFAKNVYHQSDVLYMPEDNDFKYILVICDLYDGTIDAEPLKNRDTKTIENAFAKIYSRKYLDLPDFITVDQGSEFKKDIQLWFNKNGTYVKFAPTGRSRMLASVERANQKIASVLFKRMASEELLTGETSKKWVKDLPELIEVLNEHKKKPLNINHINPDPIVDEYTGKLLEIGKRVRVQLDYPVNNTNQKRLVGKFRSSDARWTSQIYKITEVLLKPNYPPMYLTDRPGYETVAYTKNQLQPVIKKLTPPDPKFIRNENPEYYIIEKILEKRKNNNNKTEYKVKWKSFPEDQATWIPVSELNRTKDLKDMKRKFNEEND